MLTNQRFSICVKDVTRQKRKAVFIAAMTVLSGCTGFGTVSSSTEPPGRAESTKTEILEAGAAMLQTDSPLEPMNTYLAGFHPMKEDPSHQVEAHHFCTQVNEDFAQCALFDGNTPSANLNGIEYIISKKNLCRFTRTRKTVLASS